MNNTTFERLISVHISPWTCLGLAVLILATVLGNTLVLSAIFLDKRLHAPSFFLIANMATADLLLGISVLPFSSILEILDDRWIFGQTLCTTWLALDVLCCTASIIALMAVSVDRYIGVTRPLKYGLIMTIRRTVYLIILVWTISILTSVVPLFGLTDRSKINKTLDRIETCKVNKNTFYTIFSSMVSFYIPVIILLILYSRVYQEAKRQGEKLENERRRLFQIDYQIASEQVRQEENHQTLLSNGHLKPTIRRSSADHENDLSAHENQSDDDDHSDQNSTTRQSETKNQRSLLASLKYRSFGRRLFSKMKRNSTLQSLHLPHFHHQSAAREELVVIKRKLRNLKREKKAFHTLVLILGALLICWLPFFVTLPVISILKHVGWIKDENTENTWFKITFWLGYCNSAVSCSIFSFSSNDRSIDHLAQSVCLRIFESSNSSSFSSSYLSTLLLFLASMSKRKRTTRSNTSSSNTKWFVNNGDISNSSSTNKFSFGRCSSKQDQSGT